MRLWLHRQTKNMGFIARSWDLYVAWHLWKRCLCFERFDGFAELCVGPFELTWKTEVNTPKPHEWTPEEEQS